MSFTSICPTNPRINPWNFCKKILRYKIMKHAIPRFCQTNLILSWFSVASKEIVSKILRYLLTFSDNRKSCWQPELSGWIQARSSATKYLICIYNFDTRMQIQILNYANSKALRILMEVNTVEPVLGGISMTASKMQKNSFTLLDGVCILAFNCWEV